mmetsp:Transcript_6327/g.22539  ORF Transcript_6327/g.22539 Transcript_6327/m.22539 type:complete len:220 (-) Transcript_6327:1846-2505(-)
MTTRHPPSAKRLLGPTQHLPGAWGTRRRRQERPAESDALSARLRREHELASTKLPATNPPPRRRHGPQTTRQQQQQQRPTLDQQAHRHRHAHRPHPHHRLLASSDAREAPSTLPRRRQVAPSPPNLRTTSKPRAPRRAVQPSPLAVQTPSWQLRRHSREPQRPRPRSSSQRPFPPLQPARGRLRLAAPLLPFPIDQPAPSVSKRAPPARRVAFQPHGRV